MSGPPAEWPAVGSLWDHGDPAASEASFRAWVPKAQQAGDLDFELQLLTQIARTLSLRGQSPQAHKVLDKIEPRLTDDTLAAKVRYHLERGRAFNSGGDPKTAKPLFITAWELASSSSEIGLANLALDAAHMVAIVAPEDQALEWAHQAIDLAEASDQPEIRGWLGPLYHNTGWTYHDRGDLNTALEFLQKGLAFRIEAGDPDPIRIARWTIGRCYRSMGRFDEAFEIQNELAKLPEAYGYVFEELGELLTLQGQPEQARPHFAKAYDLFSTDPWLKQHESNRLARLAELGGIQTDR